MGISDVIACFIKDVLERENGCAELQRAELANQFRCVPSQINYVISTRFSPENGYVVESRRGGGGYIRIRRVCMTPQQAVMHAVNAVGEAIDQQSAQIFLANLVGMGAVDPCCGKVMAAALTDHSLRCLPQPCRDQTRARILKQMLTHSVCGGNAPSQEPRKGDGTL